MIPRIITATVLGLLFSKSVMADDNLIAQRLFNKGLFAEAAEIYTDPAWKGVALYRSDQWWRAAEAFVRADDPESYFNLGNTYVKLGYYALALDSYQAALAKKPDFEDATFNANLMRTLLAEQNEEQQGQSALQQRSDEIDRVDSDGDESSADGSNMDNQSTNDKDGGEDREGATDNEGPTPNAVTEGDSDTGGSEETPTETGSPEGGSVKGAETESIEERNPSGGSEGEDTRTEAQAAGIRSRLETDQATEQWLNQIKHDPLKYLQKRIELESARRREAGASVPEGGSQW